MSILAIIKKEKAFLKYLLNYTLALRGGNCACVQEYCHANTRDVLHVKGTRTAKKREARAREARVRVARARNARIS